VTENRCGDRQPSYLPPEVAAGKPATAESDVWQLAATVNYALTSLLGAETRPLSLSA
jgi:hypothetical protein